MRVKYRGWERESLSEREQRFAAPSQIRLNLDRSYEVHAISVYDGIVCLLLIDEIQTPIFLPRGLFVVSESTLPKDWICNVFPEGPVQLVMGPDFIAENLGAYDAIVDQRSEAVDRLWKRIGLSARIRGCVRRSKVRIEAAVPPEREPAWRSRTVMHRARMRGV
jgi:hypothetical protein